MSLSNGLSCKTGSFSRCHNPHRFLQPAVLRHYFPMLEPWVSWSVSLPSCSSWFICMQMWGHPPHQPLPCHTSYLPWLPISALPTSLNECFFNSLVVRLPYSSIFWQFWLFFVLKFVAVLHLVVRGSKAYLPTPPSWPGVRATFFWLMLTWFIFLHSYSYTYVCVVCMYMCVCVCVCVFPVDNI